MFGEVTTGTGNASAGHAGGMELGTLSGTNNVVTSLTEIVDRLLDIIQCGLAAFDQGAEIGQRGGIRTALFTDRARDILINKRLQGMLLLDNDVKSINYSTDTVNGIVYLFGLARGQSELDRVINHARNIEYVAKVVSYVSLLKP